MVRKKKLEKIMRMMKASGIVDNFEELVKRGAENVSARLNEIEKIIEDEDDDKSEDAVSAYMDGQIEKIKDKSRELFVEELISRKEEILHKNALIYDGLFTQKEIDDLYELYSSPIWKKMIELQPIIQKEQFRVMLKFDMDTTRKVLEFALSMELELRARCKAKCAFGRTVENGEGFEKALEAYGKKYYQIVNAG